MIIIRKLFEELSIPIKIESYSTQRDQNGFAYSSRNSYLSDSERVNAQSLPNAIKEAKTEFDKGKVINLTKIAYILKQNNLKIDCIFISEGVHRKEINNFSELVKLLEKYNVKANFFQKELKW